jgi:hypothetical protein
MGTYFHSGQAACIFSDKDCLTLLAFEEFFSINTASNYKGSKSNIPCRALLARQVAQHLRDVRGLHDASHRNASYANITFA